MCLEPWQHAHFVRYLYLCLIIVNYKLHESRTVEQSDRKSSFLEKCLIKALESSPLSSQTYERPETLWKSGKFAQSWARCASGSYFSGRELLSVQTSFAKPWISFSRWFLSELEVRLSQPALTLSSREAKRNWALLWGWYCQTSQRKKPACCCWCRRCSLRESLKGEIKEIKEKIEIKENKLKGAIIGMREQTR